jgi:hypothetical protein
MYIPLMYIGYVNLNLFLSISKLTGVCMYVGVYIYIDGYVIGGIEVKDIFGCGWG